MTGFFLATAMTLLQTATADSGGSAPYGEIVGEVLHHDGTPAAAANIVILGTKRGTQTDKRGHFRIQFVPSGFVQVRCVALGFDPVTQDLDLNPGETRSVRIQFSAGQNRLVDWSKARLDPELRARMRRARTVDVVRLNSGDLARLDDLETHPGGIHAEPQVTQAWGAQMIRLLSDPRLYWANAMGVIKECIPHPGMAVRFGGPEGITEVQLCYRCGEFTISTWGRRGQRGDFHNRGEDFLALARRAFPEDSLLRRMDASHYTGWQDVEAHRERLRR